MQSPAVDTMDKYNENLTDVKEIFRKGDLRAIPKPLLKWYDNNRRILPGENSPHPIAYGSLRSCYSRPGGSGEALFSEIYGYPAGYRGISGSTGGDSIKTVGGTWLLQPGA